MNKYSSDVSLNERMKSSPRNDIYFCVDEIKNGKKFKKIDLDLLTTLIPKYSNNL